MIRHRVLLRQVLQDCDAATGRGQGKSRPSSDGALPEAAGGFVPLRQDEVPFLHDGNSPHAADLPKLLTELLTYERHSAKSNKSRPCGNGQVPLFSPAHSHSLIPSSG